MDTPQFSVVRDVRDMAEVLKDGKLLSRRLEHSCSWFPWGVPALYAPRLRQESEPARQHERIFHGAFSVYYHVMARVVARCAGSGKTV